MIHLKPFLWVVFLSGIALGQPARITRPVDRNRTVSLAGQAPLEARIHTDRGPVQDSFPIEGITLHFKLSAAQQAELDGLLREQRDPASPNYHRWLSPEEYADRFGISATDLSKVKTWLSSEGFTIGHTARGRSWMVLRGTAGHVRNTFRTAIHQFDAGGKRHFANTTAPVVPEALADVVSYIGGLDDFVPQPEARVVREATAVDGKHSLTPDDLAIIYNIQRLYDAGINGAGQSMVVVGQSAFDPNDISAFRSKVQPAGDCSEGDPGAEYH